MTEDKKFTEVEFHKAMAVNLFNATWDLLDKKDRTAEDDETMVHSAHTSRYHWGRIGEPLNFLRGDWQVSRVYSVLKRPVEALRYAERCLELCKEHGVGDFDIAFAYEAIARAHSITGNTEEMKKHIKLAKEAGEAIEEKGNRDYFLGDLKTIPGYEE